MQREVIVAQRRAERNRRKVPDEKEIASNRYRQPVRCRHSCGADRQLKPESAKLLRRIWQQHEPVERPVKLYGRRHQRQNIHRPDNSQEEEVNPQEKEEHHGHRQQHESQ